jgi:hypothetical protein
VKQIAGAFVLDATAAKVLQKPEVKEYVPAGGSDTSGIKVD